MISLRILFRERLCLSRDYANAPFRFLQIIIYLHLHPVFSVHLREEYFISWKNIYTYKIPYDCVFAYKRNVEKKNRFILCVYYIPLLYRVGCRHDKLFWMPIINHWRKTQFIVFRSRLILVSYNKKTTTYGMYPILYLSSSSS